MRVRRLATLAAACLVLASCSAVAESGSTTQLDPPATDTPVPSAESAPATTSDPGAPPVTDGPDAGPTDTVDPDAGEPVVEEEPEPPGLDVYRPECVVQVAPGESLSLIADRFDDDTVTPASIRAENDIGDDVIHPGQLLDVCPGNGLDDITGDERTEPNAALVSVSTRAAVEVQQEHLNELFDGLGIPPLLIDGDSGPVTRQRLCAARVALGLPISLADMEPGGDEEAELLATTELPVPFTSSILSERWILIDQTCQIMFVGEGVDRLVYVFPTSTGEEGHRTRPQDLTPMFRYDPALHNDGWHNSTTFPVEDDNPLNGNMYRPLYFDRGQAIHGANNVPRSPQSKGCARLRVEHQDLLVAWLGLDDVSGPVTSRDRLNVTVNVQGAYEG